MKQTFSANGKLLLTGEYVVLDGATALALPVRFGQSLEIESSYTGNELYWNSLDVEGKSWFRAIFQLADFKCTKTTNEEISERLVSILKAARRQNPQFLQDESQSLSVQSPLHFPREWGFGTSSTLIYNVAQWAGVNAFDLVFDTFGGSGYDVACADANGPILYKKQDDNPSLQRVNFNPPFKEKLFLVYLGKKQNSRIGIARYRSKAGEIQAQIERISALSLECLQVQELADFENIIREHEAIIAKIVELPRAKEIHFSDYGGEIKSLGAWGGDFVLATGLENEWATRQYFEQKGFEVCLLYKDVVL